MKLRNKKTGEIRNCQIMADGFIVINSLKDLEEWEDYEEPKICWYIDCNGEIQPKSEIANYYNPAMLQIGNYFATKEEAEKAVEKLKAWKRLKDLGFKCSYHSSGYHRGTFTADFIFDEDKLPIMDTFVVKDLDLLFGGEE